MSTKRYFIFNFTDGTSKTLTLEEATKHFDDPAVKLKFENILLELKNKRRKRDGFTPGWQENIQAYAGGRLEYNKMLKERGLVEIGNDYIPQESHGNMDYTKTDSFVRDCIDSGIDLTGNEIDAIKSGDYFKE